VSKNTGLAARADQFDRPVNPCRELGRYLSDPEYRAQVDAEVAAMRAEVNRMFPSGWAQNQARWAEEERNG
jgi:hypothetical protein